MTSENSIPVKIVMAAWLACLLAFPLLWGVGGIAYLCGLDSVYDFFDYLGRAAFSGWFLLTIAGCIATQVQLEIERGRK